MDTTSEEVDMTPRDPLYRLMDTDLLQRLMRRTGTGQSITIRRLAARAGCASTTVGNLVSGTQQCVTQTTAYALCRVIGVDVLILFTPVGRSVPIPADEITPTAMQAAG
ncbi:helix-turn-helix transcriptional regulator [Streptomyces varsoviensis]|uniref:helix-turn-helix domain-containing protein n=1 Tax=Streptomyces varsoviensis TaxID=67373 RepID=UPI0033FBB46E